MTFQAQPLRIYWTAGLKAAAQAISTEQQEDYSNTHDVRHRADYAARFLTVGAALTDAQVDQIQQLRSRLDCRSVEPLMSHRDFEAAWSGAYAEATDARSEANRVEVLKTLNEAIEELEACTTDDEIMAWPYGLAVGFTKDGKPYAANLAQAVPAAEVLYTVRNGADVPAVRMRRQDAIREQVAQLRKSIEMAAEKLA